MPTRKGFERRLKGAAKLPAGTPTGTWGSPGSKPMPAVGSSGLPARRGFTASPITSRTTDLVDQRKALGLKTQGPRKRYANWQAKYGERAAAAAAGTTPTSAAPMPAQDAARRRRATETSAMQRLLHPSSRVAAPSGGPQGLLKAQGGQAAKKPKKPLSYGKRGPLGGTVAGPIAGPKKGTKGAWGR